MMRAWEILENKINRRLRKNRVLKAVLKRIYQGLMVFWVRPKRVEGLLQRVTPKDDWEYFFGYYDVCPWDAHDGKLLALRVRDARVMPTFEEAQIVLLPSGEEEKVRVLSSTRTWNTQQGCRLQWLGPDHESRILYNDLVEGRYAAVILELASGHKWYLERPVMAVNPQGTEALSLDFSRLHRLRPGYGYGQLEEENEMENCPDTPAIWWMDLMEGQVKPLFTYKELALFHHRQDMEGAVHKVNHLLVGPEGKRFMFLHRWIKDGRTTSRLLTAGMDGSGLYLLSDADMVSHCTWKSEKEVVGYMRRSPGTEGYFLLQDQTREARRIWPELMVDGHPGFALKGNLAVTDTYPGRTRQASVFLLEQDKATRIARVYAPFAYEGTVRCDLHPRWNRQGTKICLDGAFEGRRAMYVLDVEDKVTL